MSVQSHLTNTASKLVLTSTEKSNIKISIRTLSSRLYSYFNNVEEDFVFGSYDRGTILPRKVDSYSDIDYMIVFDDGADKKPQTLMDRLKKFAETYYSSSEIFQSSPTIILALNHIRFELVPAYRGGWGSDLYIPAPNSSYSTWISTDPDRIKSDLLAKNKSSNSHIKEIVRILKYWNSINGKVYSSYDLESSIISLYFFFCYNIKDYFYNAVSRLPTYGLPSYKLDKVVRLKKKVASIKYLEDNGMIERAESELKKHFPNFY